MMGEDDKVAVEAQSYGEMNNGKLYENVYHFLFKVRDGKIYSVREYSCSYTANDCFGETHDEEALLTCLDFGLSQFT